ncbi:MAG TPA: hypothetical protein PLQ44_00735 [Candidatus Paceibacterota bacterium]|nr:hypothetical protein [Candidatus Paceibacterota bacterium]HPT40118.1 hypothetical protein [Candidatus Paceibacterota bacterium]
MEKINNINLEPEEDKNILKKATESMEKVAGKVSESFDHSKLKIKTIDKIKAVWNGDRLNHYDGKSAKAMTKREAADEKIKILTEQNEAKEKRFRELGEKSFGTQDVLLSKVEAELLKSRQKNIKKIESAKNKKDKAETRVRYYENKKTVYENKVKNTVGRVTEKVDKKLKPHEIKLANIGSKIDVLNEEVGVFESDKIKLTKYVDGLKGKLEGAIFKEEKRGIKETISKIEVEIRRTEKLKQERLNEKSKLENAFAKVNKKADKWRDIRNEFSRFTNRGIEHKNIEKNIENPDLGDERIKGDKSPDGKEGGARNSRESISEEARVFIESVDKGGIPMMITNRLRVVLDAYGFNEEEINSSSPEDLIAKLKLRVEKDEKGFTMSFADYINHWNKRYGSHLKIESKAFTADFLKKESNISALEEQIRMQYMIMKKNKNISSSFSKRDLEKSLKGLRLLLKK